MNEEQAIDTFQDLGELTQTVRTLDQVGPSGVEVLRPNNGDHTDALAEIREIIEDRYGESIERLADDDEEVLIERVVLRSDDLPHIEYRVVDER